MSFIEFLGHLTFIIVAGSFLVKDILYLRILSIISCIIGIFFNYFGFDSPIWLVIFWQTIFILINSFQICILVKEKLGVKFTDEEKELYDAQFSNMSPVEFMKFMRLGEWMNIEPNTKIVKEGQPLSSVILIYNGIIDIYSNNHKIAISKNGAFLGDIEFFSDQKASATAVASTKSRLVVWPFDALRKLLQLNPTILISLNDTLGNSLARKLTR